jgi:hypothetical protein
VELGGVIVSMGGVSGKGVIDLKIKNPSKTKMIFQICY